MSWHRTGIQLCEGATPIRGRRWKLVSELGRGAFGQVWRAIADGRERALKFVDLQDKEFAIEEFRGIQTLRHLEHPNLLPVDSFLFLTSTGRQLPDDWLYAEDHAKRRFPKKFRPSWLVVCMPLAERNLAEELDRRSASYNRPRITSEELIHHCRQLASVLDYLNHPEKSNARHAPIQHCDVKPHNILLKDRVTLLGDLGIARYAGARESQQPSLGTRGYASYECYLQGKTSRFSDQYSLAITAYQIFTNEFPFDRHVLDDADRLRLALIGNNLDFRAVTPAAQRVLHRATSKEPTDRFSCSMEMLDALEPVCELAGKPRASVHERDESEDATRFSSIPNERLIRDESLPKIRSNWPGIDSREWPAENQFLNDHDRDEESSEGDSRLSMPFFVLLLLICVMLFAVVYPRLVDPPPPPPPPVSEAEADSEAGDVVGKIRGDTPDVYSNDPQFEIHRTKFVLNRNKEVTQPIATGTINDGVRVRVRWRTQPTGLRIDDKLQLVGTPKVTGLFGATILCNGANQSIDILIVPEPITRNEETKATEEAKEIEDVEKLIKHVFRFTDSNNKDDAERSEAYLKNLIAAREEAAIAARKSADRVKWFKHWQHLVANAVIHDTFAKKVENESNGRIKFASELDRFFNERNAYIAKVEPNKTSELSDNLSKGVEKAVRKTSHVDTYQAKQMLIEATRTHYPDIADSIESDLLNKNLPRR